MYWKTCIYAYTTINNIYNLLVYIAADSPSFFLVINNTSANSGYAILFVFRISGKFDRRNENFLLKTGSATC